MSQTFYIPKGSHSALIGRGGSVIRQLQADNGVHINIPRSNEESNAVLVSGTDDNIAKAKKAIEAILGYEIGTKELVVLKIKVPDDQQGVLVGRGGSTIKQLESENACSVKVPRRHDKDRHVVVEGTAEAVKSCFAAIEKLLGYTPDTEGAPQVAASHDRPRIDYSKPINEALFFPDPSGEHYGKFLNYLASAQKSLDICVFTLTDNRIVRILENLLRHNVKIRIITDNDTAEAKGSDIDQLSKMGIRVRQDKTEFHMHHKFAVLDERLLLNGSFNWTVTAHTHNCENIMITTAETFVRQYKKQFETMWNNKAAFEEH